MRTPVLTLEQKAVVCEDVIQLTEATKTLGKLSTIELVKFFNQISMKRFNVQFKKPTAPSILKIFKEVGKEPPVQSHLHTDRSHWLTVATNSLVV